MTTAKAKAAKHTATGPAMKPTESKTPGGTDEVKGAPEPAPTAPPADPAPAAGDTTPPAADPATTETEGTGADDEPTPSSEGTTPAGFVPHVVNGDDSVYLRAVKEVHVEFLPAGVKRKSSVLLASEGAIVTRAWVEQRTDMYRNIEGFEVKVIG